MRQASSLLLCLGLFAGAGAQGFGRFGYTDRPVMPDLQLTPEGVGPILFDVPAPAWKVVVADETGATIGLGQGENGPSKARLSLLSSGIGLWFPKGLRLRINSIAAPYLTWPGGSVRNGVPTPSAPWLALSFGENAPPLILGFPSRPAALRIEGKPGSWTLEGPADFEGWLRVALPLGTRQITTNSSAALGKLAVQAAAFAPLVTGTMPTLMGTTVAADEAGVTATWRFDAPNALVPPAAFMASIGGSSLRVLSKVERPDAITAEGPLSFVKGKELTIRFPARRIPTGRAIGVGGQPRPIATVSPFDAPSVAELAFENLLATADTSARTTAEAATGEWIGQAASAPEPNTGQTLLYGPNGEGIELAAAHALLSQSLVTSRRATSEANSLLTSLVWRRDWATWRLWLPDEALVRRTGALAALAAAICPEPERRLDAALFEAGLAAQKGFDVWKRRRGEIVSEPVREELFGPMRSTLFGKGKDPFTVLLQSPLRIYGDASLRAETREAGICLSWPVVDVKAGVVALASGYPIQISALANLGQFRLAQALGFSEIRYLPETAGTCEILMTPSGSLPAWVPPPNH
ncbi:hypothetical protein EON81_01260 [bacterium]|nr:MAG: hypothetical protein EON81_01260 [bacterium]